MGHGLPHDRPAVRGDHDSVLRSLRATWYSFKVALAAFATGTLLGIGLAVAMARFRVLERALLPYLVISQTIPIIVLGPLMVSLIGYASRDFATDYWAAAVILGVFLAFFPVALGTLRGLQSAQPAALELMDSFAAGRGANAVQAALPARGAVHRAVTAPRRSGGGRRRGRVRDLARHADGVGRMIIAYGREASTDPPKLYVAVFGAAAARHRHVDARRCDRQDAQPQPSAGGMMSDTSAPRPRSAPRVCARCSTSAVAVSTRWSASTW